MIRTAWATLQSQWRRFSVRLMALYLGLLLVPIFGIGLFVNAYIQQTVVAYRQQHYLDTLAMQARSLGRNVADVQETVLYLEHRLATGADVDLNAFAAAHTLYHSITLTEAAVLRDAPPTTNIAYTVAANAPTPTLIARADTAAGTLTVRLDLGEAVGVVDASGDETRALLLPSGQALATGALPSPLPTFVGQAGVRVDGEHTLFYRRAGPADDWLLLHRVPTTATHANLQDYYTTFFVLLLGTLVSVVGLALFAIARVIDPLYQLKLMFDELRNGADRPTLPTSIPDDEFGGLMTDFVRLAEELEQRRHIERDLVERLITAQEEERKRLAYDLHDGLIQELVGARFYLRKCKDGDPLANDQTRHGYQLLTEAITEGRRIMQGLHPTVLDDLGIVAAVEELLRMNAAAAGWQADLCADPIPITPDRTTAVTLYRLAQEALHNALKYADADNVNITLRRTGTDLTLHIEDDGCGFDITAVTTADGHGWGLRTMQERAHMLQGTCTIDSQPGAGTRIFVQIPFTGRTQDIPTEDLIGG
ncbi:MAG: ATP-binding protein [Chloroflexota bacterium]